VYGPGNENLKQISEETGAKIHAPPFDAEDTTLVVAGAREAVAEALRRLQSIYVEKKRTNKSISVNVNKKQHRFVIGPKGAFIQEIFKETGCLVTVPPLDSPKEEVVVSGDDAKLLAALQKVLERANSVFLEELPITGLLQRYVTLKGRQQIKDLEKNIKATIIFTPAGLDIQGPQEDVIKVREAVLKLLAEFVSHHPFPPPIVLLHSSPLFSLSFTTFRKSSSLRI